MRRQIVPSSAQKQRGHQRCVAALRRGLLPGTLSRSTSPPCTQSTAALPLTHHTTHTHLHLELERCQPRDLLLLRHLSRLHCRLDGQCWSGPRPLHATSATNRAALRVSSRSHQHRLTPRSPLVERTVVCRAACKARTTPCAHSVSQFSCALF
jgi:hypothetical protein